MKLLAIILAVMTWTVESKNVVSGSGDVPNGVEATYACNYQKGTVCAGDEAVLTLTGLRRETIQRVDVWVKSNKTGGAGVFTVSAGGETIATKSGSLKDWIGKYDTEFHKVGLWSGSKQGCDEWTIRLTGTENSLYIDRYVITYQPAPCYTVRLMQGGTVVGELMETQGGAGVLLPLLSDTAEWTFVGWCDHEFWSTTTRPEMVPGGTRIYPETDMTLWSVFAYVEGERGAVAELADGDYLYVNTTNRTALAGTPIDGEMAFAAANAYDEQLYYTMVFSANRDTAYVTHQQTGTPIGYTSQAKMAAVRSPWNVYHNGEQTVLYTTISGKTYILWLSVWDKTQTYQYAGLYPTSNIVSATMMQLLYPAGSEAPIYTCHPESGVGIEEVTGHGLQVTGEKVVQIGIYELHIRDGKKYLRIEN